jgi:WD40 repeat protein
MPPEAAAPATRSWSQPGRPNQILDLLPDFRRQAVRVRDNLLRARIVPTRVRQAQGASGSADGTSKLWDIATGKEKATIDGRHEVTPPHLENAIDKAFLVAAPPR